MCSAFDHSLEQDSIQFGVTTPEARYLANVLVSCCRSQAIRRGGPIEDYYLISWHNYSHLMLGGMTLQPQECPERKLPAEENANLLVCSWIIEELEFIDKDKGARSLEAYWRGGDIVVLS